MKLPLSWLRDWVDLPAGWDARELARRLTNAGFEVEAIEPRRRRFQRRRGRDDRQRRAAPAGREAARCAGS